MLQRPSSRLKLSSSSRLCTCKLRASSLHRHCRGATVAPHHALRLWKPASRLGSMGFQDVMLGVEQEICLAWKMHALKEQGAPHHPGCLVLDVQVVFLMYRHMHIAHVGAMTILRASCVPQCGMQQLTCA